MAVLQTQKIHICALKKNRKQIDNLAYRAKQSLKALLEKEGDGL